MLARARVGANPIKIDPSKSQESNQKHRINITHTNLNSKDFESPLHHCNKVKMAQGLGMLFSYYSRHCPLYYVLVNC